MADKHLEPLRVQLLSFTLKSPLGDGIDAASLRPYAAVSVVGRERRTRLKSTRIADSGAAGRPVCLLSLAHQNTWLLRAACADALSIELWDDRYPHDRLIAIAHLPLKDALCKAAAVAASSGGGAAAVVDCEVSLGGGGTTQGPRGLLPERTLVRSGDAVATVMLRLTRRVDHQPPPPASPHQVEAAAGATATAAAAAAAATTGSTCASPVPPPPTPTSPVDASDGDTSTSPVPHSHQLQLHPRSTSMRGFKLWTFGHQQQRDDATPPAAGTAAAAAAADSISTATTTTSTTTNVNPSSSSSSRTLGATSGASIARRLLSLREPHRAAGTAIAGAGTATTGEPSDGGSGSVLHRLWKSLTTLPAGATRSTSAAAASSL